MQAPSLWRNSPCCMNYVTTNTAMDNVPRFQHGSIYHRDQVNKPKRIFNEFEKPDILLQEFRRQIIEASHPKYNTAAKKKQQIVEKEKSKARSMSMSTATKLYQVPAKTDFKYDIHGWRTHQTGDYDVKQIELNIKSARKNFTFGRRVDLSRPLNFFPGPGSYNPENGTRELKANANTVRERIVNANNLREKLAKTCMEFRKNEDREQNRSQMLKEIQKNSLDMSRSKQTKV